METKNRIGKNKGKNRRINSDVRITPPCGGGGAKNTSPPPAKNVREALDNYPALWYNYCTWTGG